MVREKSYQRIELENKRYGVTLWQCNHLDCVDLYIELLNLLNCEILGRCRPCRCNLKFILKYLIKKWDTIKFIEFEKALKIAKDSKWILNEFPLLEYFKSCRKFLKTKIIKRAKRYNRYHYPVEVLKDNLIFFDNCNKIYFKNREMIYSMIIKDSSDIYGNDDFKNSSLPI